MSFCLSVGIKDYERVIREIQKYEYAEIRMDLCGFTKDEITRLCKSHGKLIFTYRRQEGITELERIDYLSHAVASGAAFIDIDIRNNLPFRNQIKDLVELNKTTNLITSFHDFKATPTNQILFDQILEMGKMDPALKKIVCTSHGERDNNRILAFNNSFDNMIAFNMGEKGKSTRVDCLDHGAPFTYVALEGQATASGQMTRQEIMSQLNKK